MAEKRKFGANPTGLVLDASPVSSEEPRQKRTFGANPTGLVLDSTPVVETGQIEEVQTPNRTIIQGEVPIGDSREGRVAQVIGQVEELVQIPVATQPEAPTIDRSLPIGAQIRLMEQAPTQSTPVATPQVDGSQWSGAGTVDYNTGQPRGPAIPVTETIPMLAQGATFGLADEIAGASRAGAAKVMNPSGVDFVERYTQERDISRGMVDAARTNNPGAALVSELAGGVLTGGGLANAGLSAIGRVGTGLRGAIQGGIVDGAGYGALQGFGASTADTTEGLINDTTTGAKWGAGIGAAVPTMAGIVRGLTSPVRNNADDITRSQIALLERENIPITSGQRLDNDRLMSYESQLGGDYHVDPQMRAFTRASLQRAGINGDRATPQVLEKAYNDIGQEFNDIANKYNMTPQPNMNSDIDSIVRDYADMLTSPPARAVLDAAETIKTMNSTGGITGPQYGAFRSDLRTKMDAASDPQTKRAFGDLLNQLDQGMEDSISQINPADAGVWRDIRGRYRNLLVVTDAASRAGVEAARGTINPSALQGAARNNVGRRGYARGRGDFADLADAGVSVLQRQPNSGTATRLGTGLFNTLGGVAGGGLGYTVAGPIGGTVGAGTGAVLGPAIAGSMLMSRPGQAIFSSQIGREFSDSLTPEQKRSLLAGIISGGVAYTE